MIGSEAVGVGDLRVGGDMRGYVSGDLLDDGFGDGWSGDRKLEIVSADADGGYWLLCWFVVEEREVRVIFQRVLNFLFLFLCAGVEK